MGRRGTDLKKTGTLHIKFVERGVMCIYNGVHRTCTEMAAFHVAPAMQQPKSAISTPLPWILKIHTTKRLQSLIQNHMRYAHSESAQEHYIKVMNNNIYYTYTLPVH